MKFEFSSGGIVYKKSVDKLGTEIDEGVKIALVFLNDYWGFPKGHIEKGEKPEEAAVREVGEEIGIKDLKPTKLLKKIDYWFKDKDVLIHKYVYFYLMEAPADAELHHQVEELDDAQWFSPKEALETVGYKKDNLPILEEAYKELGIDIH